MKERCPVTLEDPMQFQSAPSGPVEQELTKLVDDRLATIAQMLPKEIKAQSENPIFEVYSRREELKRQYGDQPTMNNLLLSFGVNGDHDESVR